MISGPIDLAEHNLIPPPLYNAKVMEAFELIKAAGYIAVPANRLRAVNVGGPIQMPPKTATPADAQAHYRAVFTGIAQAFARECGANHLARLERSPIPPPVAVEYKEGEDPAAFEHMVMKFLIVAPQEVQNVTGKNIGPYMDMGRAAPKAAAPTSPLDPDQINGKKVDP